MGSGPTSPHRYLYNSSIHYLTMGKESQVEINGHLYRYEYVDGKTVYRGPVGEAPEIGEQEFLAAMARKEIDADDDNWTDYIKIGGTIFVNNREYTVKDVIFRGVYPLPIGGSRKGSTDFTIRVRGRSQTWDGGDAQLTLESKKGERKHLHHYGRGSGTTILGWIWRTPGKQSFQMTNQWTGRNQVTVEI